ncbi:O-antigen ligase family protein [Achromobacter sp.]|uniref:O-antigen ligase family protein n=1 Tax=Achromobacter sp. TaxID=134375 RepID=UPI003C7536EB
MDVATPPQFSRAVKNVCDVALPLCIGLLPVLTVSTSRGGSAAFYAACVFSVAGLLVRQSEPSRTPYWHRYWPLVALLALVPLTPLLSSALLHTRLHGSDLERGLRFWAIALIVAALAQVDRERLKLALWGIATATWVASITIIHLAWTTGRRPEPEEYNAVSYGNLTLLLGVLMLFALGLRTTRWPRLEAAAKLASGGVAIYAFTLTLTRGGWLAVPVFSLVALALTGQRRWVLKAGIFATVIVGCAAVLYANHDLRSRVELATNEVVQCRNDRLADTSICTRLQLWSASWRMFRAAPLTGNGSSSLFPEKLQEQAARGKVSPTVAANFGEPHNDLLYAMANYGLPGLAALLAIYLAPSAYFLRRVRQGSSDGKCAAAMGLVVCLGFATFGLTELMFRGMRTIGLYATLAALFLVLSAPAGISAHSARKSIP